MPNPIWAGYNFVDICYPEEDNSFSHLTLRASKTFSNAMERPEYLDQRDRIGRDDADKRCNKSLRHTCPNIMHHTSSSRSLIGKSYSWHRGFSGIVYEKWSESGEQARNEECMWYVTICVLYQYESLWRFTKVKTIWPIQCSCTTASFDGKIVSRIARTALAAKPNSVGIHVYCVNQ